MADCRAVADWWTAPSCELRPERTVSAVLVPLLLLLAAVARVGQCRGRGEAWADVLLSAGKPAADVAFVIGMGVQAQDYVAHEDARTVDAVWMWVFSTLVHALLVPAFAGAEVRLPWVGLAAAVYSLSLLVLGLQHAAGSGDNQWPYALSPLVCLVFVAAYLLQHANDAVAAAWLEGRSLVAL